MNICRANFEDLLATYYSGTVARDAAKHLGELIRNNESLQLATLLRDYRVRAITSQREISLRAATDRLLTCCSVMEIASLSGFVSNIQSTNFGREMFLILGDENVRRFYEVFYPTKLPQLLRCRLIGDSRFPQQIDHPDSVDIVMLFLDLDRRFMETIDLDDGCLLRMLDSFTIQGYRFSDVVELIGEPEEFVNHLLLDPEKRGTLARAVNEFSLFMQFCFDLSQLLTRAESQPLLQSAFWHHYSYWFEIIGAKLSEQLGKALSKFLEWRPEGDDLDALRMVQAYVLEARSVLETLTSRKFAEPVDALLKVVSEFPS